MMANRFFSSFLVLASATSLAQAASLSDNLQSQFSLRTAGWSSDRSLNDANDLATLGVWGKLKWDINDNNQLVTQGFAQSVVHPDLPYNINDEQQNARLRELYWKWTSEAWNIRVGRQLIAWGRADGLNPTDNLSPKQFTLLTPDDNDLRFGNDAINISYQLGQQTLTAIWFPRAASNVIPLETQAGVHYKKIDAPHQDQYALKWETLGDSIDASISWFDGYDPMPDLSVKALDFTGLTLAQTNNAFRVLGSDFSYAEGNRVWRFEAALSDTESSGQQDFTHKKNRLWLVAGPEWTLNDGLTVNIQLSLQQISDFASPENLPQPLQAVAQRQLAIANETSEHQQGITWRIAKNSFNDTLLLETTGVTFWPDNSGLVRAKANYAISDALHAQLGYEHYHGAPTTFFGQLKKNNNVYLELRYSL